MAARIAAAVSAAMVMGAWVLCAISYATDGGGSYNTGVFTLFGLLAVGMTTVAAIAISKAWKGTRAMVAAPVVSMFAVASVVWLALALRLRG
jgi:hypothetical protein